MKTCEGRGLVRSIESQSLQVIRSLEQLFKSLEKKVIVLEISPPMAQYMLNNKYTFFDNKDTNTNVIKVLINNEFNPNKFNISTENLNNHHENNLLEDKEKPNHNKDVHKKKF